MKLGNLSFEDQVVHLERLVLVLKPAQLTDQHLLELIELVREIPEQFVPPAFIKLLADRFSVQDTLILEALAGHTVLSREPFEDLVPKSGWLKDYVDYTQNTEPPTVFHFFAGLTVMGATIARRIYFPRGSGDIFPNICAVLVAPPGKCKKTTACNIAVNLFRRVGGNVLADKITPEAIVESFKTQPTATGLIYAPEWAVFLGKQQYMEGLVPMLTALFDCPAIWSSTTLTRSTTTLSNVALSHLAATTIDWMQTSITTDAFAGGFMSRLLFVVQKTTPRSFPLPPPLDVALGKKLVDGLLALQHINGEASLSPDGMAWYVKWYNTRTSTLTDKHFAGYYERKPDRLLQLAMVLNASLDPRIFIITEDILKAAERILNWLERYLPAAFEELSQSAIGDDQLRLLKQLRKHNGSLGHSEWLRQNTSRMDSARFKVYVETLLQAKMIALDASKHRYYLLAAGRAFE